MYISPFSHHDEPHDERRVFDVPDAAVVDVSLHLQVEEEALIDDVGEPAEQNGWKKICIKQLCCELICINEI